MTDLGLGPYDLITIVVAVLVAVAAALLGIRQEQQERRRLRGAATQVGRLPLAQIELRLRATRLAPCPEQWQLLEEALLMFRPASPAEEQRRQRLLQEVRLQLTAAA